MRHAKAEGFDKPDLQRALADRGVRDSEAAGQWFSELGLVPDGALVSAAVRTRETWDGVAAAADWTVTPTFSEPLYGAGPESALDLIRETPASVRCLVVIGHNPTMAYLASILDDGSSDLSNEMATGFPTCAVAVFDLPPDMSGWADLDQGSCALTAYHVPRG
jgi:phosphohistidine phosphatase